jgi:PAS domain S-box-containing protein
MPDLLLGHVLASYSTELVAALFAAAVTLSFRRTFPRADLLSWGAAWTAATAFAALGLVANSAAWSPRELMWLRVVGRSAGLFQAVFLLAGACRVGGEPLPRWLPRLLLAAPLLGAAISVASLQPLPTLLDLSFRMLASGCVGAASLYAASRLLKLRGARPAVGIRLMAVSLSLYAVLKIFSPMTLARLGLLEGSRAGSALFLGFSLAPASFALGCVVSLLEDRERVLAAERNRLRVSEERLRLALDAAHMGIWEWNPATRAVVWSSRVEDIVAIQYSDTMSDVANSYLERLHAKDGAAFAALIAETVAGSREAFTHEHRVRGDDGISRWMEARAKAFRDPEGSVVLRGTVVGVSERKQAEEALRFSEERLRRMSEATFEGIAVSENGILIDANEQLARMLGYPLDELIGSTIQDLAAPEYRSVVADAVRRRETGAYEHLALRKNGTTLLVETRARVFDVDGHTLRITAVRDISEQAELAERLALFGRATTDAVWDWDLKTGKLWWSLGIQTQFGYPSRDCSPDRDWWSDRVHPEERGRANDGLLATLEGTSHNWSDEYRFRRADGTYADVLDRGFVVRALDGTPQRMVGAMLDVSDRKRVQETLRRNERMAAVGRLVAGVAHEVRTPLFSISATLDAYEEQLDDPKERGDFLRLLRSQIHRLSGLMHDLLNYGRPPALRIARGEIVGAIRRAEGSCARRAQEAGVNIELSASSAGLELEHDPDRLEQVFENLLSNAIHHAPKGSVVRVTAASSPGPEAGILCTVEDEGPGLREEDLSRLFEPFFSRRKGGIGLGLAIVQRIVEEHGGTVCAANRPSGGAVFTVFLAEPRSRAA